jgi:membrane fusion protein, multidrug efflux system
MKPNPLLPENRMARDARPSLLGAVLLAVALGARAGGPAAMQDAPPPPLATASVTPGDAAETSGFDGVVQAVRQTAVAAQVAGAVVSLHVKAGDVVRPGQVLLRIDARAAEQTAAAGVAQAQAARATQEAAMRDFERQKQLFSKSYISQAALDSAEARYQATQAQAAAQLASAGAARTQSGFYVVTAPYRGVVAAVSVVLGDMAMPGRVLLMLYDPGALRVSAAVPQAVAARLLPGQEVQVDLPGAATGRLAPVKTQWMPTVDPATHTLELRLDLPAGLSGVSPGMFARAWLPVAGTPEARLYVPTRAVVRRAELTAVYVLGIEGRPLLRQVRLGRGQGDTVEVLAGVSAGERVVLDPQAAARLR